MSTVLCADAGNGFDCRLCHQLGPADFQGVGNLGHLSRLCHHARRTSWSYLVCPTLIALLCLLVLVLYGLAVYWYYLYFASGAGVCR